MRNIFEHHHWGCSKMLSIVTKMMTEHVFFNKKIHCRLKNAFLKLCQEFDSFTKRMTTTGIFTHMNGIEIMCRVKPEVTSLHWNKGPLLEQATPVIIKILRNLDFCFFSKFDEFKPFFSIKKILCIDQSHIFQVKIWRSFAPRQFRNCCCHHKMMMANWCLKLSCIIHQQKEPLWT